MLRDPDRIIRNAKEMVEVIEAGLKNAMSADTTSKYSFIHIEAIPPLSRSTNIVSFPLKGIRKLHSFTNIPNRGGILVSILSCLNCTVSQLCLTCKDQAPSVTAIQVAKKI